MLLMKPVPTRHISDMAYASIYYSAKHLRYTPRIVRSSQQILLKILNVRADLNHELVNRYYIFSVI